MSADPLASTLQQHSPGLSRRMDQARAENQRRIELRAAFDARRSWSLERVAAVSRTADVLTSGASARDPASFTSALAALAVSDFDGGYDHEARSAAQVVLPPKQQALLFPPRKARGMAFGRSVPSSGYGSPSWTPPSADSQRRRLLEAKARQQAEEEAKHAPERFPHVKLGRASWRSLVAAPRRFDFSQRHEEKLKLEKKKKKRPEQVASAPATAEPARRLRTPVRRRVGEVPSQPLPPEELEEVSLSPSPSPPAPLLEEEEEEEEQQELEEVPEEIEVEEEEEEEAHAQKQQHEKETNRRLEHRRESFDTVCDEVAAVTREFHQLKTMFSPVSDPAALQQAAQAPERLPPISPRRIGVERVRASLLQESTAVGELCASDVPDQDNPPAPAPAPAVSETPVSPKKPTVVVPLLRLNVAASSSSVEKQRQPDEETQPSLATPISSTFGVGYSAGTQKKASAPLSARGNRSQRDLLELAQIQRLSLTARLPSAGKLPPLEQVPLVEPLSKAILDALPSSADSAREEDDDDDDDDESEDAESSREEDDFGDLPLEVPDDLVFDEGDEN